MAIILDTNCFANVFSRNSAKHNEFKPVLDWVVKGKGLFIYGGTQYISELSTCSQFLPIFRELRLVGKVLEIEKNKVDSRQEEIRTKIPDEEFDDKHLPAIIIESKCRLICSDDKRSIKYVTEPTLYPKGISKPKYYTGSSNANILCDDNIDKSLKPLCKLNKASREKIGLVINKRS